MSEQGEAPDGRWVKPRGLHASDAARKIEDNRIKQENAFLHKVRPQIVERLNGYWVDQKMIGDGWGLKIHTPAATGVTTVSFVYSRETPAEEPTVLHMRASSEFFSLARGVTYTVGDDVSCDFAEGKIKDFGMRSLMGVVLYGWVKERGVERKDRDDREAVHFKAQRVMAGLDLIGLREHDDYRVVDRGPESTLIQVSPRAGRKRPTTIEVTPGGAFITVSQKVRVDGDCTITRAIELLAELDKLK